MWCARHNATCPALFLSLSLSRIFFSNLTIWNGAERLFVEVRLHWPFFVLNFIYLTDNLFFLQRSWSCTSSDLFSTCYAVCVTCHQVSRNCILRRAACSNIHNWPLTNMLILDALDVSLSSQAHYFHSRRFSYPIHTISTNAKSNVSIIYSSKL